MDNENDIQLMLINWYVRINSYLFVYILMVIIWNILICYYLILHETSFLFICLDKKLYIIYFLYSLIFILWNY